MRPKASRIVLIVYDGAQSLDVFGPAEVFAAANREQSSRQQPTPYHVVFASSRGGQRTTSAGTSIATQPLVTLTPHRDDTVLVVGGEDEAVRAAIVDQTIARWLTRAARVVRRLGSVCSGAFILAAHHLLDGKRCATHWSACELLASVFPAITVDRESIFVVDGTRWTSAGVTTGIDMAIAMVDEDHGASVADAVAARLVLYVRRPGFQSQWSSALLAQSDRSDPLAPSIAWARRNLRTIDVDRLARHAGVSLRTLHRRSVAELGVTPAKLIERVRVEAARTLLSSTKLLHKAIADRCGFGDVARMQRALRRAIGVDAKSVRLLFAKPA